MASPELSQDFRDELDTASAVEFELLGILLFKPERINSVMAILKPEMFIAPLHQHIFDILVTDWLKGKKHNALTIESEISCEGFTPQKLRKYIADMICSCLITTDEQARTYASLVLKAWNLRRLQGIMRGNGNEFEKAEAISLLHREISRPEGESVFSLGQALDDTFDDIASAYKRGGELCGLPTGLIDLDHTLSGLEAGGLYVLAGRPAMGKTAAALTIAMNAATKNHPVLFFSLEMSTRQLSHRINARYAGVSIRSQKNGANDTNFNALHKTKEELSKAPLTIIDKSGMTAQEIVSKAYEMAKKQRPELIVIDHLGIVVASDPRTPRVYQVAEMTMLFKTLAKELKCPVLLLHQLNRGVEGRDDKRPSLSDLRDSGSVEQDADAVMLLYRAEYYLKNDPERREGEKEETFNLRCRIHGETRQKAKGLAEIIIAKNRQGESCNIPLRFNAERQFFENLVVT